MLVCLLILTHKFSDGFSDTQTELHSFLLLSRTKGNSLLSRSQSVHPKDPVSTHCKLSHHVYDLNETIGLQLHRDFLFFPFVPHAACVSVQAIHRGT